MIAQFIFGDRCAVCRGRDRSAIGLCFGCAADLPWLGRTCVLCATELPAAADITICPDCRTAPCFDGAVAALAYVEPVRWLIGEFKFRGQRHLARPLAELFIQRLSKTSIATPQALVPVPLHDAGFRRRGFNQAQLIAHRIGAAINRPVLTAHAVRTRDTSAQHDLGAAQRAGNVRGAFTCREPLGYRHVAVVDDVVTTANTAAAVTRSLRRAGAQRVDVYCLARA